MVSYRDLSTVELLTYVAKGDHDAQVEYYVRRKRSEARSRKLLNQ
jgi:hypothetical protein